jgi:N-acetylglucosamine-6-phosphate deacetylase
VYTPTGDWEPGWLLAEGRRIEAMGRGASPEFDAGGVSQRIDARGASLLPGFIDVHVHGAMGGEAMDASAEGLQIMARFYAAHGVTSFLPTTWTATREDTLRALNEIARCLGPVARGATILGAHLEGPYFNPAKCGAQDSRLIRRADRGEALAFLDVGVIRLVALAPEYEENRWLIEECVRRGVTVSAAHTGASYEDIVAVAKLGLSQSTHTFNAMTGFNHREPGVVGAVLTLPEIRCELIADNIHVHPAAMQLLIEAKGSEGVILVTDAIRGAGMPEGDFRIDDRVITVRGGVARLPDGQLAGSVLTMERALLNIRHATGRPLRELWPMTSLNAALGIGVSASKGSLEVGKHADLVLLAEDGAVCLTVAEGEVVYRSGSPTPSPPR